MLSRAENRTDIVLFKIYDTECPTKIPTKIPEKHPDKNRQRHIGNVRPRNGVEIVTSPSALRRSRPTAALYLQRCSLAEARKLVNPCDS